MGGQSKGEPNYCDNATGDERFVYIDGRTFPVSFRWET